MQRSSLPPPVLPADTDYCLFTDFDGTLVDFAPTPSDVACDAEMVSVLASTWRLLDGAVAIISGRQIHTIDALISPLRLPVAGLHGFERRAANGITYRPMPDSDRLLMLRDRVAGFVASRQGLVLEDKAAEIAVHFRNARHMGAEVTEFMHSLEADMGAEFELQEGAAVLQIKPRNHNKGMAVEAFLQEEPFAGRLPIYIGIDTYNHDGFAAVERHGGIAVAVGNQVSSPWRLRDPDAVRAWLLDFNTQSIRDPARRQA